jgi:hypothetical protein
MIRPRQAFIASIGALVAVVGCLSPVAVQAQGAAPTAAVPGGPGSLEGIWLNAGYKGSSRFSEEERVLLTVDGKFPPMQPWAAELLKKRIADSKAGHPFANTLALCLPGGVPLMIFGALIPIQFVESPGQITILYMEGNRHRVIHMNEEHPKDVDPGYMGDSVGKWEGDTLVIDTVGIKLRTTIDQIGTPHTDKLHVVERYKRIAKDTLEIRVHIEDPGAFTQPWDAKVNYKLAPPGTRIEEDICENNRNPADEQGRSGFQHF